MQRIFDIFAFSGVDMKKKLIVGLVVFLVFSGIVLPQKKKQPVAKTIARSSQTEEKLRLRISEIGSEFVTLSVKGELGGRILFLSKRQDSVLKALNIGNFTPMDTVLLSSLKEIEGKWLLATNFSPTTEYICINGLNRKENYHILVYEKRKEDGFRLARSIDFNTLEREPTRQASKITILPKDDGSYEIRWLNGNGEGRILVAKRGNKVNLPKDGQVYEVGADENKGLGQSRVLANIKGKESKFLIKDLESGRWTIQIFEYNGDGRYRNYLVEAGDGNPRQIFIPLPAPVVNPPGEITNEGFVIGWSAVEGATTYYIEIATDVNFRNKVEEYNGADVGNVTEIEIQGLNTKTRYYFRVKAKTKDNWSNWSNPIAIETK